MNILSNEKNINITPLEKMISTKYITKYEFPSIISIRTQQIDRGSKVFIEDAERFNESRLIALEEFKRNLIPFILKRPIDIHKNVYEYVKISDLKHYLKK
tara:strand:- start:129 stop:428 length:300 start_codon:yes stop_codon:yes gene_type:complete